MTLNNCRFVMVFLAAAVFTALLFVINVHSLAAGVNHLEPEDGPLVYGRYPKYENISVMHMVTTISPNAKTGVLFLADSLEVATLERGDGNETLVRLRKSPLVETAVDPMLYSKPIREDLFSEIERVWRRELLKVKYEKIHPSVTDGVIYHFFAFDHGRSLSGVAQTVGDPKAAPSLHNLLQIASLLAIYAKCDKTSESEVLLQLRKRLSSQLQKR